MGPDGRRLVDSSPVAVQQSTHRLHPAWLAVPAAAFVVAAFALPFLGVVRVALAAPAAPGSGTFVDLAVWSPATLLDVASDPLFGAVLGVTLRTAAIITVTCMVVAVPFAAWVHTRGPRLRAVLVVVVALPKLVNLLVLLYGVLLVLGRQGVINDVVTGLGLREDPLPLFGNLFAVVFTEVLVILPYPVLLLLAAFSVADPTQREAARSLGAGPVRAYVETVVVPAWPAVAGAALVSAVWAVGAFVGPLVLGNPPYYTVAVEVYVRALERLAWVEAAGWAVLGVAIFGMVLAGMQLALRRRAPRPAGGRA